MKMAALVGLDDGCGVSGAAGGALSGAISSEVPAPAPAPAPAAVNQTGGLAASPAQEETVYNCRMCRRALFSAQDIQNHEPAQHYFHRRKVQ